VSEFERLGREYLADLLGEDPALYPPTHPKGPRGIEQLDHAPWLDGLFADAPEPEPERQGVCVLRRSCGRSCYCAKAGAVLARQGDDDPQPLAVRYAPELVVEMRRRFGRHWPAEPRMAQRVDWVDPYEGLPAVVDRVVSGPVYGRLDALDALDATIGNYVASEYLQQWRQS
jgi:hypothetical protein